MKTPRSGEAAQGLHRSLNSRQMSMLALGGAIGTGLFLGSKFAISLAGPSVIVSYMIGGLIAVLLMGALAEMTVRQPVSGSFGVYAHQYLGPFAGFLIKYLYWSALVLAVGTEVTAVGDYMQVWFPQVPPGVWVALFSVVLLAVNMANVKTFGTTEYWFSAIKVFAVIAFILVAASLVFFSGNPDYGVHNYTADSPFFANGFSGTWIAVIVAIFSYMGIEVIAVAAAEAQDPKRSVRRAFRVTLARLVIFYLLTLGLILAIAPVDELLEGGSPFVTVMQIVGIPFADSVLNFVVIVAALSAMNSQLYAATRTLFSLSQAGHAPRIAAKLARNGAPVNAVWMSAGGIGIATVVFIIAPESGLNIMIALSMFGALSTWMLIFVTHLAFRRFHARRGMDLDYKLRLYPAGSLLGAGLLAALLVTSIFTESFRLTLSFGIPFVIVMALLYRFVFSARRGARTEVELGDGSRR